MGALRAIVLAALIAGGAAGLVAAAVQSVTTWPLIRVAESYEHAAPHAHGDGAAHEHESAAPAESAAPEDASRIALTVLADVLAGIGYALLLAGVIALTGAAVDARRGLAWGAAGFAAVALAPALGLPPAPPGMAEAELAARQGWWVATAAATAGGLWLIAFRRGAISIGAAVVLIALPHLVGAPQPAGESSVPAEIAGRFATASLAASAVFWLVLGAATGAAYGRFER